MCIVINAGPENVRSSSRRHPQILLSFLMRINLCVSCFSYLARVYHFISLREIIYLDSGFDFKCTYIIHPLIHFFF